MSKKQTRRSISFRAEVYATAVAHARERGVSVTSFVEAAVVNALNAAGATMLERGEAIERLKPVTHQEVESVTGVWTF